jgi:hypothetical protein
MALLAVTPFKKFLLVSVTKSHQACFADCGQPILLAFCPEKGTLSHRSELAAEVTCRKSSMQQHFSMVVLLKLKHFTPPLWSGRQQDLFLKACSKEKPGDADHDSQSHRSHG